MEKPELRRRLRRLYLFLLLIIVLVVVNQYYAGGLFELIPPVAKSPTPGPTRASETQEHGPYPVDEEEIEATSVATPTTASYPIDDKFTPTATATFESYPMEEEGATLTPGVESYPVEGSYP